MEPSTLPFPFAGGANQQNGGSNLEAGALHLVGPMLGPSQCSASASVTYRGTGLPRSPLCVDRSPTAVRAASCSRVGCVGHTTRIRPRVWRWGESERRAPRASVRGRGPCPTPRGRERPGGPRGTRRSVRTRATSEPFYVTGSAGCGIRDGARGLEQQSTRAVCRIPCIHGTRRPHPHELTAH